MSPLGLSLAVALGATGISGVAGVLLGRLLARPALRGRDLLDALVAAPLVLPPTVLGYYVLVALGRRSGLGRAWESLFGAPIVFTRAGLVVAATLGALPLVTRSSRAAFEGVDRTLVWAARTLGATPWRAFVTVELPLAWRGVAAGLTFGFARALGDFGVTLMVAGDIPGETRTAALALYGALQAGRDDEAHRLALTLTAFAVAALALVNRLGRPAPDA